MKEGNKIPTFKVLFILTQSLAEVGKYQFLYSQNKKLTLK